MRMGREELLAREDHGPREIGMLGEFALSHDSEMCYGWTI